MLRCMSGVTSICIIICNLRTLQSKDSTNVDILTLVIIENKMQEVPLIVLTIKEYNLYDPVVPGIAQIQ